MFWALKSISKQLSVVALSRIHLYMDTSGDSFSGRAFWGVEPFFLTHSVCPVLAFLSLRDFQSISNLPRTDGWLLLLSKACQLKLLRNKNQTFHYCLVFECGGLEDR